ncbi:cob(I)yrinic acid a,c-diamide adenosyltransferase [Williamwhitmania taraxaci]|uniref:Corrinoid adenosyltransferase n=1 Tax=Williamwhitmania taraxaci TaxID=1640674 RepID=A0A1G6MMF2_9BACT|nr:cob(I)yrinic acid a,c-diamide adenosyltransferase [Williamwhitmania taraxaci]SDC56651.1 ATP:cob(I)alamin adenosyltransferase [Williamwhitmania taraxaci]
MDPLKIYTKGGDKGTTSICGGIRVEKDDIRIEANGTLDEACSTIGIARAMLKDDKELHDMLLAIQESMMTIMGVVATPSIMLYEHPPRLPELTTEWMEKHIDDIHAEMGDDSEFFLLPGGNILSAQIHVARTQLRRAERHLVALNRVDELHEVVIPWVNRLSDLFFALARVTLHRSGDGEDKWHKFQTKIVGQ